ncbi:MAG TPA: hypothetical protein VGK38_03910 [Prolixibacteraceae bacterium]
MEFTEVKMIKTGEWLANAVTNKTTDSEKEVLLKTITVPTKPVD